MKIPEYNRQASLDIAPRSNVSIKEPEIFRDTSSVERIGKQMLGTAEDMSNIYLDMKKERDNGIVNEFMNQFSLERVNKLNELKEQYKGANSEGIVDAYMEWQEDYIAKRTGFNQDMADGELYLENDEQIKAARDTFAKNLPSTVNSLSNYVAQELETYKTNQFEASVANWTTQAVSDSEDNLQNHLNMLDSVVDNYYVGQPPEYIAQQKNKLKSNIYESRLNNAVLENPDNALILLQNDNYKNSLSADKLQTIEKSAINNWKSKIAGKMASANTLNPDDVLTERDAKIISPYVEKYGKDRLEWDIVREARRYINARKDAEKKKIVEDTFDSVFNIYEIQNDTKKTDEEKTVEIEKNLSELPFEEAVDLNVALDNISTIEEYEQIKNGTFNKSESIHIEEDIISINERERNPDLVSEAMDYIDNGDIIELKNFHPQDAKLLLDRMALSENWRKLNSDYKEQTGKELNTYVNNEFNRITGLKHQYYPFYNFAIKNELAKYVHSYKNENGKYPQGKDFEKIIVDTIVNVNSQNPNISKLIKIENLVVSQKSRNSEELFLKYIDDKFGDYLLPDDKKELASSLMLKRYNKALYLVDHSVVAQKQKPIEEKKIQAKKETRYNLMKAWEYYVEAGAGAYDATMGKIINPAIEKGKEFLDYIKEDLTEEEKNADLVTPMFENKELTEEQENFDDSANISEYISIEDGNKLWKQVKNIIGGYYNEFFGKR